jgi:hypothetical protein
MSGLGEQIAVLDGLSALDPNDGRIGQARARVNQYAKFVMRNVLVKRNMIQASNGANYSGGSNYFPGGPLLPSTIGLADFPGVLPGRRNVIDPSFGVNHMGGSSYAPRMPLLPSNAGLAASLIEGGYGRAGLGASLINGGYGRAGLGATGTSVDEDLAGAAEAIAYARNVDPNDGRIGQTRARVDEYGRRVMPGVLERSNVIDPSEGGNYGGGSNYFPGGPLTPSNSGLAGCASCDFGAVPAKRMASPAELRQRAHALMINANNLLARSKNMHPSSAAYHATQSKAYRMLLNSCYLRRAAGVNVSEMQCRNYKNAMVRHMDAARKASQPAVRTAPNTQQWR